MRIGEKVLRARKEAGLTQKELSERADVSRQWICTLEKNITQDVMFSTLCRVAKATNKPLEYFADSIA
jgi:transcriptional regulator with XRE-family HTH domain